MTAHDTALGSAAEMGDRVSRSIAAHKELIAAVEAAAAADIVADGIDGRPTFFLANGEYRWEPGEDVDADDLIEAVALAAFRFVNP